MGSSSRTTRGLEMIFGGDVLMVADLEIFYRMLVALFLGLLVSYPLLRCQALRRTRRV